jgi:hypothetical protein
MSSADNKCITEGCDEISKSASGRCEDCSKHRTRLITKCECGENIYTSGKQLADGKRIHGENYKPFTRCIDCRVKHKDDNKIVYQEPCCVDDCENYVELTQSNYDFYTTTTTEAGELMVVPKRCADCLIEKKEMQENMVTGTCGYKECMNDVTISKNTFEKLKANDKMPYCKECVEKYRKEKESDMMTGTCSYKDCDIEMSISKETFAKLKAKGQVPHCLKCRNTFTRRCKVCDEPFFTCADYTNFKAKGWIPPRCCSKECNEVLKKTLVETKYS